MPDYKGKIIKISDVWDDWKARINNVPVLYTLYANQSATAIFDETFVTLIVETEYQERSYLCPLANASAGIEKLWLAFRNKHDAEYRRIYDDLNLQYDPRYSYSETKTLTPNITNATTNTYGRTSTNSGGISNTYGKTETRQTNTYDGQLRDSEKVTNGGSDSNTNTLKNTLGGTDSSSTTTTGSTTETINGYKDSAIATLEKDISFQLRYNVADNYIKAFMAEYTFFDNDNARGCNIWPLL